MKIRFDIIIRVISYSTITRGDMGNLLSIVLRNYNETNNLKNDHEMLIEYLQLLSNSLVL